MEKNIDVRISYLMFILLLTGIAFTLVISFHSGFGRLKNIDIPKIVCMFMVVVFCFILFLSLNLDKMLVLFILVMVGISVVVGVSKNDAMIKPMGLLGIWNKISENMVSSLFPSK